MVDTLVLEASAERRESSSLSWGTKFYGVVSLVAKPRVVIPLSRVRFSYDSPSFRIGSAKTIMVAHR
jgi:hypothetical protein